MLRLIEGEVTLWLEMNLQMLRGVACDNSERLSWTMKMTSTSWNLKTLAVNHHAGLGVLSWISTFPVPI